LNPLRYHTYWQQQNDDLEEAENKTTTRMEFHMLPRRPLQDRPCKPGTVDKVAASINKTDERLHDYFFMGGMLLRWLMLCQALPETTEASWVFDAFPDGAFWKQAVEKHGLQVLNVVHNTTIPLCKNYHGCGHTISDPWFLCRHCNWRVALFALLTCWTNRTPSPWIGPWRGLLLGGPNSSSFGSCLCLGTSSLLVIG